MFPRTDGALKLKYFNIFLPSNMIRNFTESYTLASDEPEPEPGPETGPDAIISSSEGKGENIGPQRKQPGDNYCVSCSALLPPMSLFLCESHFQYCLQIWRESVLSRLPLYLMWGVTHKMMKWFSSTEARTGQHWPVVITIMLQCSRPGGHCHHCHGHCTHITHLWADFIPIAGNFRIL